MNGVLNVRFYFTIVLKMYSHLTASNYFTVCRLCLCENQFKSLFTKYNADNNNKCYAEMIMACSTVQVEENDGLPSKICLECVKKLQDAYTFKEKCEEVDNILRSFKSQYNDQETKPDKLFSLLFPEEKQNDTILRTLLSEPKDKQDSELVFLSVKDESNLETETNAISENDKKRTVSLDNGLRNESEDEFQNFDDSSKFYWSDSSREENNIENSDDNTKIKTKSGQKQRRRNAEIKRTEKIERTINRVCEICSRILFNKEILSVHMAKHKHNRCLECNGKFRKKKELIEHIKIEHPIQKSTETQQSVAENEDERDGIDSDQSNCPDFTDTGEVKLPKFISNTDCPECDSKFTSISDLQEHVKLSHSNSGECEVCIKGFHSKDSLKLHIKDKHKTLVYKHQCQVCSKLFRFKSFLRNHMVTHAPNKPVVKCDVCHIVISAQNLRRHKMRHTGEQPHKCPVCNKGFIQKPDLTLHLARHADARTIPCMHCEKAFYAEVELRTHVRNSHMGDGKKRPRTVRKNPKPIVAVAKLECTHLCKVCGRGFPTKQRLKSHELFHGEKKFLCSECGNRFATQAMLNNHRVAHTDIRPYKCEVCGKAFKRSMEVKTHMVVHNGVRKFKCTVCEKMFKQPGHLQCHMLTHTEEKPHACSMCGKCFALKKNLNDHIRIHTGEKPYTCPVCGKAFINSNNRKQHLKTHNKV